MIIDLSRLRQILRYFFLYNLVLFGGTSTKLYICDHGTIPNKAWYMHIIDFEIVVFYYVLLWGNDPYVLHSVADPGGATGGHAPPQTVDKSFFTHQVYQL